MLYRKAGLSRTAPGTVLKTDGAANHRVGVGTSALRQGEPLTVSLIVC